MELAGASLGIMNPLGTLIVSNSATINGGGDAQLITNNGTFTYMSTAGQTLSGVISGTGRFIEQGIGKLTISGGANPFTGSWVINSTNGVGPAVLSIAADTNLGAWPAVPTTNIFLNGGDLLNTGSPVTLNTNRVIGIGPTNGASGTNGLIDTTGAILIVGGAITSAGNTGTNNLVINSVTGTGKVALAGTNSFNGGILVSAGVLSITNAGYLGRTNNYAGSITNNTVFSYDSSAPQTLSGVIYGSGTLAVTGSGTLTLTGPNIYTGNTTISSGGTLTLGVGGELGGGPPPIFTAYYTGNITNNGTLNFNNPSVPQALATGVFGTGSTSINAGTLSLSSSTSPLTSSNITVGLGATLDVSAVNPFTLTNQTLMGYGTINGSLTAGSGSKIYAGLDGTYGTNTFNNSLTLKGGAAAYFDLGTKYNQSNDLIVVGASGSGTLALNGTQIHLKAPSTSVGLDTANYTLFKVNGTITGTAASTPIWDVQPTNPYNFSIVTGANTVTLNYSTVATIPPMAVGSIAPANLYSDQHGLVTVTITPGSSPAIKSVVLDESSLGATPATLTLVSSNSTYVYTNTVTIPNNPLLQGSYTLPVTATDGNNLIATINLSINVASGHLWNGGATPIANWSSAANWVGGVAPDLSGDNLFFDGTVNTAPQEDQSYTVSGLTFNSTAGSFNIGPATQTLNLTGGITNNSANTQMMNVGISADYSPVAINAAAADLVFAQNIDISGPLTVTDGGHNTVIEGPVTDITTSGSTWTMAGAGTNTLLGTNSYAGNTSINSGTLAIGLTGQLGAAVPYLGAPPVYAGNITNNGTLLYNSTNFQTLSGIISGRGSLDVIGLVPRNGTNTTLVLSGASTFTNNVIISNAYVSDTYGPNGAGAATALGVANLAGRTVTINSNGVLSIDAGNAFTGGSTAVALGFIINQGGVMQATVANSVIGPVTLNGGILQLVGVGAGSAQYQPFELSGSVTVGGAYPSLITNLGNGAGGLNLTVNTGGASQTTFNVASTGAGVADLTVALPLGNSGGNNNSAGLIKAGPGTMALTGSNVYTGVTTLSNGILNLGVADTPGTAGPLGLSASYNPGSIVFAGGTLQYSAANNNDYSGRFSTAAGQPIIIDTAGQSVTFATPLTSPGGSLTKLGLGALSLAAAETYSGSTIISQGTLQLTSIGSLTGTTNISIGAGALFIVPAAYTLNAGASITGYSGATSATSSAISGSGTISFGANPIILNYDGSHPALTVYPGSTLTLHGNAFTVNGPPLAVDNTYYLITQSSGSIASSGTYTVSGTAIAPGTAGTITVSGGSVILNLVTTINLTPPNLLVSTSPTSITLGWPANPGWRLQYQSNSVTTGLLTNASAWLTWPGSTTVTQMVVPIGKTNEIFFRMVYP
jgi:autotransporter-associated beta strand protein